jgi:hypothetical protein
MPRQDIFVLFFLTPDGSVLPPASCRILRVRKCDGETLPLLARLVKRLVIQREPRMAIEIRDFFSHTTMKENRIPQSPGEPIEGQRSWEAIPFFVIREQLKPAIHVVDQIPHHHLIRFLRHRARIQSVQHQRQTLDPQQETNPQHNQANADQGPILFHKSDHDGFSVTILNEKSSIRRFQIQRTYALLILVCQGRHSTSRRDQRRHSYRPSCISDFFGRAIGDNAGYSESPARPTDFCVEIDR